MPAHHYDAMNAAELMDRVFDVYKKSFVKQLAFSAVVGIISFFAMILFAFIAAMAFIMPAIDYADEHFVGMLMVIIATMLPIYWIWGATADAGNILLSKQAFYKQPIILPIRSLPGVVLRVLTASLAQIILSLPWLLLLAGLIFVTTRMTGYDLTDFPAILQFLSSYAWIFIGVVASLVYVVYSNIFALSIPISVFERRYFFATVTRSWRLMKGSFWKILGIRILWMLVVYLFTYSAQGAWVLLQSIINTISGGVSGMPMLLNAFGTFMQSLVTLLIGFLMGPLSGILTALLYFNQRIKKEGLDIEIGLVRLSQALPALPEVSR